MHALYPPLTDQSQTRKQQTDSMAFSAREVLLAGSGGKKTSTSLSIFSKGAGRFLIFWCLPS